jgi:asparagine synthase (glutamine-hydrolysing)
MARIAGFLHWGRGTTEAAGASLRAMLAHLSSAGSQQVASPFGTLGVAGAGGDIAEQPDRGLLVVDGRLLDRTNLDDGGPGGDAALLLRLCLRVGFEATMHAIDGDVAVAFLDLRDRRLWLGRDRVGVKPLYYAATGEGIAFASQPAPLALLTGVGTEVNRRYVALVAGSHYRTIDNAIEDSPFARVRQLPAAHCVTATQAAVGPARAYWRLATKQLDLSNEDALAEQYRALLFAAVRRRLAVADNPGFTLSGGMDSSSVACTAARLSGRPQPAFSSIYVDPTFDERREIQDVVDARHVDWHPVELANDLDILSAIERLVRVHNEPVATATWLSHDIVCQAVAASGHGALFGGLGGDELNAGEYEYFPLFFADLRAAGETGQLEQEIASWARYHDHPIHKKNPAIARQMMATLTKPGSAGICLPNLERQTRYHGAIDPHWFDLSGFTPVMEHPFTSFLANRAYQDLTRETTPCCLRAEDRQSEAHGLAHFDPFLDRALIEFMFSIPSRLKIRDGVTKHLLRKAMRGILPEATRTRVKKSGWNAPAHVWFSGGRGLDALSDIVSSRAFRARGIYNLPEVERLLAEHRRIVTSGEARENHMMFLWQLVNLECWFTWIEAGLPAPRAPRP